jgi:hypothetical protein
MPRRRGPNTTFTPFRGKGRRIFFVEVLACTPSGYHFKVTSWSRRCGKSHPDVVHYYSSRDRAVTVGAPKIVSFVLIAAVECWVELLTLMVIAPLDFCHDHAIEHTGPS